MAERLCESRTCDVHASDAQFGSKTARVNTARDGVHGRFYGNETGMEEKCIRKCRKSER